jgi:predicted acetyltransferase
MPGGALVPVAAVSWVSVLPTHRRRGILTQMIAALHDDARERGEAAAILTASESVIYGRYGYGIATWRAGLSAERTRVAFRDNDDSGSMRIVKRDEGERVLPALYDRFRRQRAGMVNRPDFWWANGFWDYFSDRGKKAFFVAVHCDAAGHDDGYIAYEVSGEWNGGLPDRQLLIWDLQAEPPRTRLALWRYAFGVDLVGRVVATNTPIDDPLRHAIVDPRRVRFDFINDGLWLAPLDPIAVLGARSYTVPGRVVFEVHAPDGAKSTLAVESDGVDTQCCPVSDAPDLVCSSAMLGAGALGGTRWSELAAAGRADARDPARLALADTMFQTAPAPAMLSYF